MDEHLLVVPTQSFKTSSFPGRAEPCTSPVAILNRIERKDRAR